MLASEHVSNTAYTTINTCKKTDKYNLTLMKLSANTIRWVADEFNLFLSKVGPEQGLLPQTHQKSLPVRQSPANYLNRVLS